MSGRDEKQSTAAIRAEVKKTISNERSKLQPTVPELIHASDLGAMSFPEPVWIVPDLLPAGLAILAGKPKLGKSWLALNVALAVAMSGQFLNRRLERGKTVYFGLEDTLRRLQSRLGTMLQGGPFPSDLIVSTALPRVHEGGLKALETIIEEYAPKMTVIDTLARFRPPPKRSDGYQADTDLVSSIKHLADSNDCCILLVHHLRKGNGEDPLDQVSGTTGIAGAADSILILKRLRGGRDAELLATGRDFDEMNLAIRFYPDLGTWGLLGDACEVALSAARQEILEVLRAGGPMAPSKIARELGKNHNTIKGLVVKMALDGLIYSVEGRYEVKS